MKALGWIASVISIVGVFLNAYQIIWCWPVWNIANLIWIYLGIKQKNWSLLILWIVFTISNFYAWYIWAKI